MGRRKRGKTIDIHLNPFLDKLRAIKRHKKKEMDPFHRELAVLSHSAYQRTNPARLKAVKTHLKSTDYALDTSLTSKHMSVFHNSKLGKTVVAFRGTKCNDGIWECLTGDLATDAALAIGLEKTTKRFSKSLQDFDNVLAKYKDKSDIVLTGHSLGGSVAQHVYQHNKKDIKEVHVFNPGAGIGALFKRESDPKYHTHHIIGDPISTLSMYANDDNLHIYGKHDDADLNHSLDNFFY